MKNLLLLFCFLFVLSSADAAPLEAKEKKYDKVVYNEITQEKENMTIFIVDAVSTDEYFKFKLRIHNKSADYLKIDFAQLKVVLNGGLEFKPMEKPLIIAPGDFGVRVIDIKGPQFRVTQLDIILDGIFSVSSSGKVHEAPIFKLPVSNNTFEAGPFKVVNKGTELKTDIGLVKLEVTYTGSQMAIVQPMKVTLKMPVSGNQFANMSSNRKAIVLGPGESQEFTLIWKDIDVRQNGDMQKVNMDVLFKDAFMESKATAVASSTITLSINESLSK